MTRQEINMFDSSNSNNEADSKNLQLSGEDSLKLLVGENAKYATVEELAKAMVHSQSHITTLEVEATAFKDSQAKQTSMDDILKALAEQGNQQPPSDNQPPANPQDNGANEVDITKTVQDALDARDAHNSAAINVAIVEKQLIERLGNQASEMYSKVGKSLGVDLDKLAETSPQAVINLVTGQQTPAPANTNLPLGNQHSADLGGGELTYSKIQEQFAKGGMSREAKFKLEMSQAIKLGDKFYDK